MEEVEKKKKREGKGQETEGGKQERGIVKRSAEHLERSYIISGKTLGVWS
jgi:hypothetical protein